MQNTNTFLTDFVCQKINGFEVINNHPVDHTLSHINIHI